MMRRRPNQRNGTVHLGGIQWEVGQSDHGEILGSSVANIRLGHIIFPGGAGFQPLPKRNGTCVVFEGEAKSRPEFTAVNNHTK